MCKHCEKNTKRQGRLPTLAKSEGASWLVHACVCDQFANIDRIKTFEGFFEKTKKIHDFGIGDGSRSAGCRAFTYVGLRLACKGFSSVYPFKIKFNRAFI